MSTYGRQVLTKTGRDVQVLADLQGAQFKVGGITVDYASVATANAASLLIDKTPIAIGDKYLRFGQIMCKITQSEVQTVDLSGDDDPTGGTFTLTVFGETLTALAYNISAADLQAAIRSINNPNAERVTVSKTGFVYTITFPPDAGNVAAITTNNGAGFTGGGGDTFAITVATTTSGVAGGGKYGPYDPNATDGRQTLSRGNCYINNRTVKQNENISGLDIGQASDHPQVFDGGTVWKDRILMTTGTHSLAAGPTVAEFEAAFPRIAYAG